MYELDQSDYFLLKFSDLPFQDPATFDYRRDGAEIDKPIAEIGREIKPFRADPDWEVFASAEVGIQLEAEIRKAWLKRGARTSGKVNTTRASQNYIGLLNQRSFDCRLDEMPWQNQAGVIAALKQFKSESPDKKICIVWDNAAFDNGKLLSSALSTRKPLENLPLINFPPSAPEPNPIEQVWNEAKGAVANLPRETFAKTTEAFAGSVGGRKFEDRI